MIRKLIIPAAAALAVGVAGNPTLAQDASIRPMIARAKALADAGGGGRFKAEMVSDPTLPTHTIYRPRNLAAAGKIPIVAWGNGGCFNRGDIYRYFLTEMASHGYLVVAIGPVGSNNADDLFASMGDAIDPKAPLAAANPAARAVAAPLGPNDAAKARLLAMLLTNEPIGSTSSQMKDAIDWAFKENNRKGSVYFHHLDTTKVAVMGISCGGMQAIENSLDPRVSTTIVWNSGTYPGGLARMGIKGVGATREQVTRFHGPVAYISGDESDIAFKNANDDFAVINGVPAFRAYKKGIGHDGTYIQPAGGDYGKVGIAWLDWVLKKDAIAGRMFEGPNCTLCTSSGWTVSKKNIE